MDTYEDQERPEDHYDKPSDEEIELWEQLKDEREIERSWR